MPYRQSGRQPASLPSRLTNRNSLIWYTLCFSPGIANNRGLWKSNLRVFIITSSKANLRWPAWYISTLNLWARTSFCSKKSETWAVTLIHRMEVLGWKGCPFPALGSAPAVGTDPLVGSLLPPGFCPCCEVLGEQMSWPPQASASTGLGKDPSSRVWGRQKRWLMASPTWWTWVWASSGSWRWTGKPGVLQSMGSQRLGQDWATELTDWLTDWLTDPEVKSLHQVVMLCLVL